MEQNFLLRLLGVGDFSAAGVAEDFVRRVTGLTPGSDEQTSRIIERLVAARGHGIPSVADPSRFVVAGVLHVDGGSQGISLTVEAKRSLSEEWKVIAEVITNDDGEFSLLIEEKDRPLVRIAFYDRKENRRVTAPRRAEDSNWFEWSHEPSAVLPRPGAFELREALIQAQLQPDGRSLLDLREDGGEAELTTLAEFIGVSRAYVVAHAVAAHVARSLELPAQAAFALASRGLRETPESERARPNCTTPPPVAAVPADVEKRYETALLDDKVFSLMVDEAMSQLVATPFEAILDEARSAVRSGRLSCGALHVIESSRGRHLELRRSFALQSGPLPGTSWRGVLLEVGFNEASMLLAADVLLSGTSSLERLAALVSPSRPEALELLHLASLFDYRSDELGRLKKAKISSGRALAMLSSGELDERLIAVLADRPDANAARSTIIDRLDRQFVGEGLLRRTPDIKEATRAFVAAGDLPHLNIEAAFRSGAVDADVRHEAMALQRVARVAKHGALAAGLYKAGYRSASEIAASDKAEFALALEKAETRVTEAQAEVLHATATARVNASLNLFVKHNQTANGPATTAFGSTVDEAQYVNAPSWEVLFGPADWCDCEDCGSVTSPAAYLVDLLRWLQRAPGGGVYQQLVNRRPDLVKLLLNCANSNTLVPYIDLVCELLEDEVGLRSGLCTASEISARLKTRQTRLSADEIRSYPEHIDREVYDTKLATFGGRMVQPFDLSAEEARAYLSTQNVSRRDLLRIFDRSADRLLHQVRERLFITPAEWTLLTASTTPATQWPFAGPNVPLVAFLRAVPPRTGNGELSYDELLELLKAETANPTVNGNRAHVALLGTAPVDSCQSDQREVRGLTAERLDTLHRFVRLARHVAATYAELDLLLRASGGSVSEPVLPELAALLDAREQLGLSLEEIATLFVPFTSADVRSDARIDGRHTLYARTFLTRVGAPVAPAFVGGSGGPISDVRAHLIGSLGIDDAQFAPLLTLLGLSDGSPLSFSRLHQLYRVVALSRACGLSIAQFGAIHQIVDPFLSPTALLQFLSFVPAAKQLGADVLAIAHGASPAVDVASLAASMLMHRARVASELAQSQGASPTPAQIDDEIITSRSWAPVVVAWLALDARYLPLVLLADDIVGGELAAVVTHVVADTPAEGLSSVARLPMIIKVLGIEPAQAALHVSVPTVGRLLGAPSLDGWRDALLVCAVLARANAPAKYVEFLAGAGSADREALASLLGSAFGLEASAVVDFWDALFGANVLHLSVLREPSHVLQLLASSALSARLGVTAVTLSTWASPWPTATEAGSIRNAVRAKLPTADWFRTSTKVQDMLREHRRDALVRYLLATAGTNDPKSTAELYGRFLIDTEMDDCMDTSRVVQANAAIQLFVQRSFLGMEGVTPTQLASDHWKQWDWRQRYRLWEANRLVFLYPENFLNVAKRSTATPAFDGYMKTLRQGDADEVSVRGALDGYLQQLEEVSNLDYVALATNAGLNDGFEPQLHVVARTRAMPHRYHHRFVAGGAWSPWKPLEVGSPGNHFALAHAYGKTTLLWPLFTDYQNPRQTLPSVSLPTIPAADVPPPDGVTHLSYNWVTRDGRAWSQTQSSTRALVHRRRARTQFVTRLLPSASGVEMLVFAPRIPVSSSSLPGDARMLGQLRLQRDITWVGADDDVRALEAPIGEEHQLEVDRTHALGFPSAFVAPPFRPWAASALNTNRLSANLASQTLAVPQIVTTVSTANGVSQYVASVDVLKNAPGDGFTVTNTGELWGFTFTSFGAWQPSPNAFVASDSERSLLVLSLSVASKLSPTATGLTTFNVYPAYHAYADALRDHLRKFEDGLERVYAVAVQEDPATAFGKPAVNYAAKYGAYPGVKFSAAAEGLDFDPLAPYSAYNWEFFFHAPLFVAEQLRQAGRHAEARRYFQYIFAPFTSAPVDAQAPYKRFWNFKPFRDNDAQQEDVAAILVSGATSGRNSYEIIEFNPFDAHLVAQSRPAAYQKHVFMRYMDNLIAWGDSLYRRGDRESVYEAIQYYTLAQQLLGPRPQKLRPMGERADKAFEDVSWSDSNALVELENAIGDVSATAPSYSAPIELFSAGSKKLYFCVPPNPTLLGYWDEVERRLYNIRHCLTIDGAPVRYDLLAAPIDPQALVDAAAAGVSVADALSAQSRPLPPYRFASLWARAWDACNEVKTLGGALLSALEKRDGEQLSALRSTWEGRLLEQTRRTRETSRAQALAELDAMLATRTTIEKRRDYFASRTFMNELESTALDLSRTAGVAGAVATSFDILSGLLHFIPQFSVGANGVGGTPSATAVFGGEQLGSAMRMTAQQFSLIASIADRHASMTSTQAGYARRMDDWQHQTSQAQLELAQLEKQLAAARLRVAVADAELKGHEVQERSWRATDEMLAAKFSNQERYERHAAVLQDVYRSAYEHALSMAKLAQQCLAFELPHASVPAVAATHWEGAQQGLFAGERLASDLRELERVQSTTLPTRRMVTQHVPLSQVAPTALIDLRTAGACSFQIPAWWFQRFDPGLSQRRVKSVAVSVPAVVGPYTGMNLTLRCMTALKTRSAISLSHGNNDGGGATPAEQYAPFEGLSLDAATSWSLGFPVMNGRPITDVDFSTITDVILHVEYWAEEAASNVLVQPPQLFAFIDLRAMAPAAWNELVHSIAHTTTVKLEDLLPSALRGLSFTVVDESVVTGDTDVSEHFTFTLTNRALTIALAGAPPAGWDWSKLRSVLVAVRTT